MSRSISRTHRATRIAFAAIVGLSVVGLSGSVAHAQTLPEDAQPTNYRGAYCASDTGCSWNDLCAPTRCVAVVTVTATECGESLPEPGTCSCVESQCTLRPNEDRWLGYSAGECDHNDGCVVETAAAQCHSVDRSQAAALQGAIVSEGPHCSCGGESRHCQFEWAEPVPCATSLDCGWSDSGRLRPMPVSPQSPRAGPREPCIDGEFDSVCVSGTCQLMFWEC